LNEAESEEWEEEEESVEPQEEKAAKETVLFNVKVNRKLLQEMEEAVEASDGKYDTKSDLARDAIERRVRFIKEGGLRTARRPDDDEEPPTKHDKEYETSVKTTLGLIEELAEPEVAVFDLIQGPFENFIEGAKENKLIKKTAIWSDSRVQKAMRDALKDDVYPTGMWDETRKFRESEARAWIKAFKTQLKIPGSVARNLVEDPALADLEPYEEE